MLTDVLVGPVFLTWCVIEGVGPWIIFGTRSVGLIICCTFLRVVLNKTFCYLFLTQPFVLLI